MAGEQLAIGNVGAIPYLLGEETSVARKRLHRLGKSDISKAKRLLGWEPTIPLEEGLARTVEYFRSSAEAAARLYG